MRTLVAGVVTASLLSAPASAQIQDDLGGRLAAICAADVLDYLTESQRPYSPVFHIGLVTYFMGCTYYIPPSVGPILSTMQADIGTIQRYWEDLPDAEQRHLAAVCYSWWAIYSSTYNGLIPQYGSDIVGGLPTPDHYATACEDWANGR